MMTYAISVHVLLLRAIKAHYGLDMAHYVMHITFIKKHAFNLGSFFP